MMQFLRLLALWKPEPHIVDGRLTPTQPRITEVSVIHDQTTRTYTANLGVHHPRLNGTARFGVEVTEDLWAKKKATMGHHLVTQMTVAHNAIVKQADAQVANRWTPEETEDETDAG